MNVAYVLYMGSHMDGVMYVISAAHVVLLIGFCMTICQKKWSGIIGKILRPIQKKKTDRLKKQIEPRKPIESIKQLKMTTKDWVIMLSILFLYGCVAFFNLGDRAAPQTFYGANDEKGSFFIEFWGGRTHRQHDVLYRSRYWGELHISLSVDGDDWTEVGYMEHNNVFLWNKLTIDKVVDM